MGRLQKRIKIEQCISLFSDEFAKFKINQDIKSPKVNFVEFWEVISWINKNGKYKEEKRHFAWLTDIPLNKGTIITVMRGGRARSKIMDIT